MKRSMKRFLFCKHYEIMDAFVIFSFMPPNSFKVLPIEHSWPFFVMKIISRNLFPSPFHHNLLMEKRDAVTNWWESSRVEFGGQKINANQIIDELNSCERYIQKIIIIKINWRINFKRGDKSNGRRKPFFHFFLTKSFEAPFLVMWWCILVRWEMMKVSYSIMLMKSNV